MAAWIEMPESESFLRDREMAETVDLLCEGAAGRGIEFQVVEICAASSG